MFEKRIASEDSKIVDQNYLGLWHIFNKLGKEEASEFEIWKTAKELGIPTPKNISNYCSLQNGILRFIKR